MEFIIVTGLSGAGKSRVVTALEDIGYYCVDNMPPKLLPKFAELCIQSEENLSRVAMVVDVRGGQKFGDLFDSLAALRQMGSNYKILFLDCDDQVLARRYKETRRQHPLTSIGLNTVQDAIAAERELLKALFDRADYLINTTFLSPAQLKERVTKLFLGGSAQAMAVQCLSFGFKYGYPSEADLVFDVRCFPNPFYEPELKNKTGLDKDVRDYVTQGDEVKGFEERLYSLMDYMLPLYQNEGKSQLVIAIGCTGGKHRSVTLAETLTQHIAQLGYRVTANHRDIGKL
ncbi:MAG: RNase adapter RapZ [Oscillospiraceae bacterium]|nr:RNase adapter RapZ [Oscillospiraceae bacterium]MDD3832808.1 RNase adapter RapZ [Oscillospiraceae bacterium]MDD4546357.1 RNase adapter RapZ [Oscillospiraceae bacterium]